MPPTEQTDLQDDLRVIYEAQGYINTYADTPDDREWWIAPNGDICGYNLPDPTVDNDDAGLAEFARLLLWAHREGFSIMFDGELAILNHDSIYPYQWMHRDTTPQEAFVRALAAAIRARGEE